ncbi:MAG: hypothetical protein CSB02_00590 [Bacteroidia bacterium]|nr:MAG: hypothetical protein CSB02_00590 [Bacteroidia bacterium]
MEFIYNTFVQFGALGLLLAVFLWLGYNYINFSMQQVKENYQETKERLDKITAENKANRDRFEEYLIKNSKEQLEVIKENTVAINKILEYLNEKKTKTL